MAYCLNVSMIRCFGDSSITSSHRHSISHIPRILSCMLLDDPDMCCHTSHVPTRLDNKATWQRRHSEDLSHGACVQSCSVSL